MEVKEEFIANETVTKRSKDELRKGFIDLIRKSKKGVADENATLRSTGGGSPTTPPSPVSTELREILPQTYKSLAVLDCDVPPIQGKAQKPTEHKNLTY